MKLLKYTVFRSCKHEDVGLIGELCRFKIFNSSTAYVGLLGFLGMLLSFHDIVRLLSKVKVSPCNVDRGGIRMLLSRNHVTPGFTRDLRLIGLILSLQYYIFLIIGSFMKSYIFFLPWMLYYTFIILLEFAIYLTRISLEGMVISKHSLIISIFVIYNWFTVYCAYGHLNEETNKSLDY